MIKIYKKVSAVFEAVLTAKMSGKNERKRYRKFKQNNEKIWKIF